MKKLLIMTSLTGAILFSANIASAATFKDVGDNFWAKDEINYLFEQKIMNGYDGLFQPNKHITKAQAAIVLAKALDLKPNGNSKLIFKDVSENHHAYDAILAVVEEGIFPKETYFKPNEPMTRKGVAEVIVNAFQLQDLGDIQFKDVPKSADGYQAITTLAENDIAKGYEDGTFKPNQKVTRAEFSIFMVRALNNDFLPTQYNVPMNVNPVAKLFDLLIKDPKSIPSLFKSADDYDFPIFDVKNLDVHELNEIGRLNGVTEFGVKLTVDLKGNANGFLKDGYNELYFLITKEDYMMYKIQSVDVKPHLKGDDSIAFKNEDALSLFKESQKAYWTVVSGGEGLRDQTTFTQKDMEYRYMAESLETKEKLEAYLGTTYSPEKVSNLYKQLGFITHNGKLAQPNADGGSILNWEKATITQTSNSTTVKKYELKVQLGEEKEYEIMVGELGFVEGQGWRVNSLKTKDLASASH